MLRNDEFLPPPIPDCSGGRWRLDEGSQDSLSAIAAAARRSKQGPAIPSVPQLTDPVRASSCGSALTRWTRGTTLRSLPRVSRAAS